MRIVYLTIMTFLLLLGGCSGLRVVDSQVKAFGSPNAIALPASYRFERLPSQQGDPQRRDTLEAIAEQEFQSVGLRRDDAAAQYSVALELRIFRDPRAPWDDPPGFYGYTRPFIGIQRNGATVFVQPVFPMFLDIPNYRREIHLVLRRLPAGPVVFETRANHDGPWSDDDAVVRAMLEAALRDFPDPPRGLRRIDVEIPR